MAATVRLKTFLFALIYLFTTVLASPILLPPSQGLSHRVTLEPRRSAILNNATGEVRVFNPATGQLIPQGPATDGGGTGSSPPAQMWIVFSLLFGIPLTIAGVRGWRCTTGTGIGLAAAVCVWAAFVNTIPATGISDLLLTVIVIGTFWIGFILGLFEFGRLAGIICLGITGGLSFGIRIMLLRSGLLFPGAGLFAVNWILIALLGACGGLVLIWWQRAGIVFACASVGTFLTALGIDLIINKQAGMSRGLRFLFDRNTSHLADILVAGYRPPLSTPIILVVSITLTPVIAYGQHRIFKAPFNRRQADGSDLSSLNLGNETPEKRQTRFSLAWADAKSKMSSRFSL